jgi:hypothetical protein
MENMRTTAPGVLAKGRAWLRGDRYMVDSGTSSSMATEPDAPPAPRTGAQAPAKEK